MKLLFAVLIFLAPLAATQARPVQGTFSSQELFDKSDLVVIAQPASTKIASEQRLLPGMEYAGTLVIGVETTMKVSVVLKGKKSTESFIPHHYRVSPANTGGLIDGPTLLHFDPTGEYNSEYLLFLVREPDGRYAPVAGQVDPATTSVRVLWQANLWEDVKAWREEQHSKSD